MGWREYYSKPAQPQSSYFFSPYRGCFDIGEDEIEDASWKNVAQADAETRSPNKSENKQVGRSDGDNLARTSSLPQFVMTGQKKILSGPLLHDNAGSSKKKICDGDR